ncbi:YbaB/EbfC family nucleoid-associated protein [Nocardia vinacea]|uniref:YbaB/EbfC family nucleoid-associated protein n=1 Tax=Nocardia vinacea TaxID=96468 RepID=UPI0002E0FE09|nr:YbaB/EbfC family nucleoid-associated protein [Nocardia vinacea]
MTYLDEWEQQLQRDLGEIRSSTAKLAKAAAAIRGRSTIHGVAVEVDTAGAITNLHIPAAAMKGTSTQLGDALMEAHRRARADAQAKAEELMRTADPRLRAGIQELRGEPAPAPAAQPKPMTEEQIQAADDAYFERMNEQGWRG